MTDTTRTRTTGSIVTKNWTLVLLAALAMIYLTFGSVTGTVGILGIAGAAAAIGAMVLARRSRTAASVVLVVGVVPFALVTWWSVVIPITALLFVAIGLPLIKRLANQSDLNHRSRHELAA